MHLPNPEPPVQETLAGLKETDPKYHQTLVDMTKSKDSDTTATPSKESTEKGWQQPVTYRTLNPKNAGTLKEKGPQGK
jgi:hypothetical protein